jgi:predicted nucleic acid-binding protein
MIAAFEIACHTKHTVYDSLYLAIAVSKNCQMVTADRRFYETIKKSNLSDNILWVEDIPN